MSQKSNRAITMIGETRYQQELVPRHGAQPARCDRAAVEHSLVTADLHRDDHGGIGAIFSPQLRLSTRQCDSEGIEIKESRSPSL